MKFTKKDIDEIIDSDGELIGSDDIPQNGADLETAANGTTDQNVTIGHQPYRYDMLGRFGFTLLPFFEGKEDQGPDPLLDDLAAHMFEEYKKILEFYYRNPNKLKSDFRKLSKQDFETGDNEHGFKAAERVLGVIKPHFEGAMKELDSGLKEGLNENSFVEGKVLEKSDDKDVVDKSDDNGVQDNKLKKIAGLINKLDKEQVKKIKNLLETD